MKKIFYYLMSAVVAFGAMACQNDIDENITPDEGGNGEKVSFVAEIGDMTRVAIGDKVDGEGYPITLDENDVLIARAYDQGEWGDPYTFTTTDDGKNFSCETAGVSELIGKEVIIYNGNDNTYCSLCGINGISLNASVNPFEANSTIKFTIGNAVLMFESEYDVTFNTTTDGFFSITTGCPNKQPDDNQNSITIPASEGVHYIAVNGGKEADLSYSIDGVECKKIENYLFEGGKLYNLGTLEKIDRVYLAPGDWDQENAWFAAYFYKNAVESVASASATRAAVDANEVWVKMTDNDGDGTYECIVPEGFPNVVFCRMKSDDTETMSFDNAWNQTVDIAIDTTAEDFHENNSYFITSWGNDEDGEDKKSEGAWGKVPNAVVTPNETSTWSLVSDWDGTEVWSDKDMVTTATANLYVLKNVALEAYSEFKVRKDKGWDESYGGGYNYINANNYVQLYNNGQNVSVTETGNYDIYFHSVYKLLYVVTTGTDYTTATWQEANGQGPAVDAPEFTDALVYLVPDMWAADGAWFSAHFFNAEGGAVDVKMTDEDADGIYECNVPVGMESVIFCRMNPAYDEFSWDDGHVWTEGANLTIGVAPNNYYYITDWETGEWNVEGYDPNATVPSTPGEASPWSLSGTFNEWGDAAMVTTSIANVFVVEDVTLDAYASFKVRKDKLWDESYGGGIVYMNPNGYIQVFNNGSDISNTAAGTYDVYFDYANKLLYLVEAGTDYTTVAEQTVEGEEPEVEEPEVTENVLYLKPNANWKVDNARFAAYFFNNSGNVWVGMADSDSDGIYEVNIPTGYTFGDNVIFCRMNPSTSANNWNNKWNQTADLTIPTDGKNLYTVADGTWDKGGGAWSTK